MLEKAKTTYYNKSDDSGNNKYARCGKMCVMTEVLKVSATSNPNLVAGAIAGAIRQQGAAEIQAIGASAVIQAIKAAAIACSFMEPIGVKLAFKPSFMEIETNGEVRTAIRLVSVVIEE